MGKRVSMLMQLLVGELVAAAVALFMSFRNRIRLCLVGGSLAMGLIVGFHSHVSTASEPRDVERPVQPAKRIPLDRRMMFDGIAPRYPPDSGILFDGMPRVRPSDSDIPMPNALGNHSPGDD